MKLTKKAARRGMHAIQQFRAYESEGDAELARAQEKLRALKLRAPSRPRDGKELLSPELPADITRLSNDELGRLHSEFAAMAQYTSFYSALKGIEYAIAKRLDKITRARVRLEKSGTVDDKAAKVETDSRTRRAALKLLGNEGAERLTSAVHEGFIIGRDACSREMTRRQNLLSD